MIIDFNNWIHYKELIEKETLVINKTFIKKTCKIFVNSMIDKQYQDDKNMYKIFMQTEPRSLQNEMLNNIENNYKLFDLILAHDEKLLSLPNSILFQPLKKYFWVQPPIYSNISNFFHQQNPSYCGNKKLDYKNKRFPITMLCGHKTTGFGNRLRIKCWNKQNEIGVYKRFYRSHTMGTAKIFSDNITTLHKYDKSEMFIDSMFHVAIENSSHKNYFTEKLNDCILTHTIPIYWGCPNISEFYNTDGFILFKDENDFIKKINNLTPDYYYSKLKIIQENYERFINLKDTEYVLEDILSENL